MEVTLMRRRLLGAALCGAILAPLLVSAPAHADVVSGWDLFDAVPIEDESAVGYDEALFHHWIDADDDGCDTRSEVLQRDVDPQTRVSYSSGCTVDRGYWYGRWGGGSETFAADVRIDHTVDLAEAWRSGAHAWTPAEREAFSNDLGFPGSLHTEIPWTDQQKSDLDPAGWLPFADQDRCDYALEWVAVKWRWALAMDLDEAIALDEVLGTDGCGDDGVEVDAARAQPDPTRWPLVKIVYANTIYELVMGADGSVTPTPLTYERWRDFYGLAGFSVSATDFVKYPWSDTVYAVTFWPGGEARWQWTRVAYDEWRTAGFPAVRHAGWIKDSSYYQWGTSSELFVEGPDGVNHRLSYQEWSDSGFRSFDRRTDEGFMRLASSADIVRLTSIAGGQGYTLGYEEWREEAFPTPEVVQSIPGRGA
jgi:hypothetical protein